MRYSGMDMTPRMSAPDWNRDERRYRYAGTLHIKTPKVSARDRKKWFGVPPTPLETKPKWRSGGPVAF